MYTIGPAIVSLPTRCCMYVRLSTTHRGLERHVQARLPDPGNQSIHERCHSGEIGIRARGVDSHTQLPDRRLVSGLQPQPTDLPVVHGGRRQVGFAVNGFLLPIWAWADDVYLFTTTARAQKATPNLDSMTQSWTGGTANSSICWRSRHEKRAARNCRCGRCGDGGGRIYICFISRLPFGGVDRGQPTLDKHEGPPGQVRASPHDAPRSGNVAQTRGGMARLRTEDGPMPIWSPARPSRRASALT